MYHLSLWARHHAWTARIVIVIAYFLLNVTGWLLGEQLALSGIYLSQTHFYIGTVLALAGFFAYPAKKHKRVLKHFYRYQKSCDGLLAGGTFVLIVCLSQPQSLPQPWMGIAAQATNIAPTNISPTPQAKQSIFRKLARSAIRWLGVDKAAQKKIQKSWQRLQAEYRETSKGGKIALIALFILIAAALIYLLMGLSCTIACNGSDALAIVVFVLGLGGIILLLVRVINRIQRGPKRKQPGTTESTTTTAAL